MIPHKPLYDWKAINARIRERPLKAGARACFRFGNMKSNRYGTVLAVTPSRVKIHFGHNGFERWVPRENIIHVVSTPRTPVKTPEIPLPQMIGVADRLLLMIRREPFVMGSRKTPGTTRRERTMHLWRTLYWASLGRRMRTSDRDWPKLLARLTDTDLDHIIGIFRQRASRCYKLGRQRLESRYRRIYLKLETEHARRHSGLLEDQEPPE